MVRRQDEGPLQTREPQRVALYKATAALVRSYANISDELAAAGYTAADITRIKHDLDRSLKLREVIRQASGETIDLKAYEADMRHLIDTYIDAAEPRKISPFDDLPLLELIVKTGIANAINSLPEGIKANPGAIAETIANNVRSKIIKDHLNDPAFYDKMSNLLDEIIADLRAKRISYEEYLQRIARVGVTEERFRGTATRRMTQGHRLVWSAQSVGWDQRRFAAPAHPDVSTFPEGGPALEASWSHPTICQAKPPRPPFSTGCSREPLGCDLGRDETDAIGIANAHSYVSFHQGNGASGQLESHQVGLYLLKQVGAMYLLGSANYGYNDLDVTRTAPLGFVSASAARSIALLAGLLAGSTSPAKKSGFQKIPDFGRVRTFWQIPCNLRPETPQDTA